MHIFAIEIPKKSHNNHECIAKIYCRKLSFHI